MDLSDIIAVSGRPGLFKIQTQTRTGVVATSLLDGKRITTNPTAKLSILNDIQVYCIGEEIPLSTVFEKLLNFESGGVSRISPKSNAIDLEAYFFEVLENYDEDRVYASDIKKIIQWYNLLVTKKILHLPATEPKEAEKSSKKSKITKN